MGSKNRLEAGGRSYKPRCCKCGSYNTQIVTNEKRNVGAYVRCGSCGSKSERFGDEKELFGKADGFDFEALADGATKKQNRKPRACRSHSRATLDVDGRTYTMRCPCGSCDTYAYVSSDGSAKLRCKRCKRESERFPSVSELFDKVGGFKFEEVPPGKRKMRAKAAGGMVGDADRGAIVKMARDDAEFLGRLRERRGGSGLYYELFSESYVECPMEEAEFFELYDPNTQEHVAYVGRYVADAGELACMPVRKAARLAPNSVFLSEEEALSAASAESEGRQLMHACYAPRGDFARLLGIVDKIDWTVGI